MARRYCLSGTYPLPLLTIILLVLSLLTGAQATYAKTEVDALRDEYFGLERDLWQWLDKATMSRNNMETQLRKVYNSHRNFTNKHQMQRSFPKNYEIGNYSEWRLLERDIIEISDYFNFYKTNIMMKPGSSANLEERAVLDFTDTVLRNNEHFSMSRTFQDIENIMVKQALYYRVHMVSYMSKHFLIHRKKGLRFNMISRVRLYSVDQYLVLYEGVIFPPLTKSKIKNKCSAFEWFYRLFVWTLTEMLTLVQAYRIRGI